MNFKNLLLTVIVLLFFTACSKDGSSSSSDNSTGDINDTHITGVFIDDAVKNLNYSCTTSNSDLTDIDGKYICEIGEDVSFLLNTIKLGSTISAQVSVISPYNLFPSDTVAAINLARLLQSIDTHNIPNIIELNTSIIASIPTDINFSSLTFESDIESALNIQLIDSPEAKNNLDNAVLDAGGSIPSDTNNIPIADAGKDQLVSTNSEVTLDGSASFDSDNDTITYLWSIQSKPNTSGASLSNSTSQVSTFTTDIDGEYVVSLTVNDGLLESLEDTISISSSTSNTPILSHSTGIVDENASIGTSVGNIVISSTGTSAVTAITLSGTGNTNFDVSTSGAITLSSSSSLDYETKNIYDLTAIASNSVGDSPSVNVTISIRDINETIDPSIPTAPVLTSAQTISVNENQTTAFTATATDINGDDITYSISTGDFNSFDINSSSGVITFISNPDFETKILYTFLLTATDITSKTDTQNILININNIAEVVPTLADFTTNINENIAIGTNIGNITITNSGDSDITSFNLKNSTNFEVNSSGSISTKTFLNYESNSSYLLEVNATNLAGDSNTSLLTINIIDLGEFYITSAIYFNNNTSTVLDDKLYIYFNENIDSNSISIDMSTNYLLEGNGAIGSASLSEYNSTNYQHIISLNNNGSISEALVAGDTNISIASNVLQDLSGKYTIYDENKTTVGKLRPILKTGQTTIYFNNDDGRYQSGNTRSYTDLENSTILDNETKLIWQKSDDALPRNWNDANSYCSNLTLGSSSNWRLPIVSELFQLTDKGKSSPAIESIFTNTKSELYWSTTQYVIDYSSAWVINFDNSVNYSVSKAGKYYVRCVR